MNWSDFFHMGGYAFHVWSSWGLTTLIVLGLVINAKVSNRKIRKDIKRQLEREQKFDAKKT